MIQRTRNEELAQYQSQKRAPGNPTECGSYDCIITGFYINANLFIEIDFDTICFLKRFTRLKIM